MPASRETTSFSHDFSAAEIAELVVALGTGGALCPLVVKGVSMVPTLREYRDTVYLRSVGPEEPLRVGDVVFFWRDGRVVLHRLVRRLPDGRLRMNGDGQLWCEDVPRESVFAVAERVKRGSRVMPLDHGVMRVWGVLWMRLLPVRERLWHLPRPLKRAVRRVGALMRGGDERHG